MREIKFRAWLKFQEVMIKWENLRLEKDEEELFLWVGDDPNDNFGDATGESDFILMQYTGFKDKNGTEIYEGDIYENPNGVIGSIEWHSNDSCYHFKIINRNIESLPLFSANGFLKGIIIGNVYDNPELLERVVEDEY